MGIRHYGTQEEMDADFEDEMDARQEEARLKDLIGSAEERVAQCYDELADAEEELTNLREQLEALDLNDFNGL